MGFEKPSKKETNEDPSLKELSDQKDLEGKLELLENVLKKWPKGPDYDMYRSKAEELRKALKNFSVQKSLVVDDPKLGPSVFDGEYLVKKETELTNQLKDLFVKLDQFNKSYLVAKDIVEVKPKGVVEFPGGSKFEGVVAKLKNKELIPYGMGVLFLDDWKIKGVWRMNHQNKLEVTGLAEIESPEGTYNLWYEDGDKANGVFVDNAGKIYAVSLMEGVKHIVPLPKLNNVKTANNIEVKPSVKAKLPDTGEIALVNQIEFEGKGYIVSSKGAYELEHGKKMAFDQELVPKEGEKLVNYEKLKSELLAKISIAARAKLLELAEDGVNVPRLFDKLIEKQNLKAPIDRIDFKEYDDWFYIGEVDSNGKANGSGLSINVDTEQYSIITMKDEEILPGSRVYTFDLDSGDFVQEMMATQKGNTGVGFKIVREPLVLSVDGGEPVEARYVGYGIVVKDNIIIDKTNPIWIARTKEEAQAKAKATTFYAEDGIKGIGYVFEHPELSKPIKLDAEAVAVK